MGKKIFSLVLAVLFVLSLCGCGKSGAGAPHPLSVNFQTEDELVAGIKDFFSSYWEGAANEDFDKAEELWDALKNNTSIHHYFQESDEAIALAHRLCDTISDYYAYFIFDACNTSDWFSGIAETEAETNANHHLFTWPLFFTAWHYDRPTFDTVADAIRDNFKDPLSVSVLKGEWSFINPVDGYFEGPLSYVGIVEVRATNSFGAYLTQEYVIGGNIRGEITLIDEYDGYSNPYERYHAQAASLLGVPWTMEAENTKRPLWQNYDDISAN